MPGEVFVAHLHAVPCVLFVFRYFPKLALSSRVIIGPCDVSPPPPPVSFCTFFPSLLPWIGYRLNTARIEKQCGKKRIYLWSERIERHASVRVTCQVYYEYSWKGNNAWNSHPSSNFLYRTRSTQHWNLFWAGGYILLHGDSQITGKGCKSLVTSRYLSVFELNV